MQLPPIWVISLERATDRRRFFAEGFAALGIEYEIVDAVDGRLLSPAERSQYSERRALFECGRTLTEGEVGCSLSHLRLLERMVRDRVPVALIMEDDVRPNLDLIRVLESAAAFPGGWDVVTMYSLFEVSDPKPVDDTVIVDRFRVCSYGRTVFGTQCYLITMAAAQRVLDVAYPLRVPYDGLLFRRRPAQLRIFGVEPHVVSEGDFESELEARDGAVQIDRNAGHVTRLAAPIAAAGKVWHKVRGS